MHSDDKIPTEKADPDLQKNKNGYALLFKGISTSTCFASIYITTWNLTVLSFALLVHIITNI